jgi:hypothetical protein
MDVLESVRCLDRLDIESADVDDVRSALVALARAQSWLDAMKVNLSRKLTQLAERVPSISPHHEVAHGTRSSQREAQRVADRGRVIDRVPEFGSKLAGGEVSAEHVDALGRGARQLEPADRDRLLDEHGARLADLAARVTPEAFAKAVGSAANTVRRNDGTSRFERQRRATALRSWVDRETGMVHIRGQFDPETGGRLIGRLQNTVEALFHDVVPDTCPADPGLKQDHLRALALIALTDGEGAASGRAEMIVVIDEQTMRSGLHERSIVDHSAGVDVPVETLRRIACAAELYPAVLGTCGVTLDLGRSARLADANQRRALRAMYPTCMIDECAVPFDRCEPHHIDYWRNGGRTDLARLGPLCSRHHHLVHEGGWELDLDPITRVLTITHPDRTTRVCTPPRAQAA